MDAQQQIEGLYQQHSMLIEEYKKLEKLLADTEINLSTVEQVNAELLEACEAALITITAFLPDAWETRQVLTSAIFKSKNESL